jgi:hypothetical protein
VSWQLQRRTLQGDSIRRAPLAAVEQGLAIRRQQRHQIFGHHRRGGHGPGQGELEVAAALRPPSGAFHPLTAQREAIGDAELFGHRRHGIELALHRIHQGEPGLG